jgi:uncharacterized membrane protein
MNTNTFSISEAFAFGWASFKKDPWFFVGATLALWVFSFIINMLTRNHSGILGVIGFLIGLAASTVVTIAYAKIALSTNAGAHVSWNDLWAPNYFLPMLGTMILQGICIVVGLILLIVPGIIVALMLAFSQLIVVDQGKMPIEALKESFHLTKGHLWQLFLFALAVIAANIVGAVLLVVGLLVSVPVTLIAAAYVYKKLLALPRTVTPQATVS